MAVITFGIPFYGKPTYLRGAIASVLAQTTSEWKLWVFDDRSPHEGAREVVESFGDPRIRYELNPQNLGQAGNWNRVLDAADTELVTVLHDDDELLPGYAEAMIGLHARHPDAAAAFCGADIIDEVGRTIWSLPDAYKRRLLRPRGDEFVLAGEDGLAELMRGNSIFCPTLCFRRERLGARRFDRRFVSLADIGLTTQILLDGGSLVGTSRVAYRYRRHVASWTSHTQRDLRFFEEEVALFRALAEEARSRGWSLAERRARRQLILKLRVLYAIGADLLRLEGAAALKKSRFFARSFILRRGELPG